MFEQLFFKMIILLLKKVSFVDLGLGSRVMNPNSSTNRIFQSVDVIPVTTKISHIKIVKPVVS